MRVYKVNCLYASSAVVTTISITAASPGEAWTIAMLHGYTPISVR
jgi:hypothetical protein